MNALTCNQNSTEKRDQNARQNYGRGFLGAGRGEIEKEHTRFAFERKCRKEYQKDAVNGHLNQV